MCGIFGAFLDPAKDLEEVRSLSRQLADCLAHRGPDDRGWAAFAPSGEFVASDEGHLRDDAPIAHLLGQTRLSIIDLSPEGHQPMRSEDGRYTLVYNGEIYNYLELRAELEILGVRFCSHSDTEVLLHALINWGTACLPRLTGMFAFALHDAVDCSLLLVRDFFGIKPLYYHWSGKSLAFASEIPALLKFPGVEPNLAPQQVYNYLCFGKYDRGDETFFQGIYQIPPGHLLRLATDAGTAPSIERYWKPDLDKRSSLSFSDAASRLRDLFLDSVRLHLRSDVPLGVALSGGIDSSAVACAVHHLQPETELHTFSFVAKDSPVSEESWAQLVASHTRAIRHIVTVEPHELADDVDTMILRQGEPFGSTSIYAQYRVFRLAREAGIKVTLDGQGADELLAGYNGYPGQRMASLLLQGNLLGAFRFMRAKSRWPGVTTGEILRHAIREFTPQTLLPLALALAGRRPLPGWLDAGMLRSSGVRINMVERRGELFPTRDMVRQTLAYQLTHEGLQQLLRHGDRNAMAFSVESRVPFLTREMAEFCLSLPEEYLIDMNGRSKSVFREAMRGLVPDAILDRRDKIGFATPEEDWLSALSPWVDETLASAASVPYLNIKAVRDEWHAIQRKKRPFGWHVWRWVNYIRWVRLLNART